MPTMTSAFSGAVASTEPETPSPGRDPSEQKPRMPRAASSHAGSVGLLWPKHVATSLLTWRQVGLLRGDAPAVRVLDVACGSACKTLAFAPAYPTGRLPLL